MGRSRAKMASKKSESVGCGGCLCLVAAALWLLHEAGSLENLLYWIVAVTASIVGLGVSIVVVGVIQARLERQREVQKQQERQEQERQQQELQRQEQERQQQELQRQQQPQQQHLLQQRGYLLQLHAAIEHKTQELGAKVQQWFMIQPCSRCHEFRMVLLEISPNARSVHYQCPHCEKKMHASAGTPDAPRVFEARGELDDLVKEYRSKLGQFWHDKTEYDRHFAQFAIDALPYPSEVVTFEAPAAPLPYEQTSRTPIPEAIRSEVWRRDGGRCVQCRSKQNLQFDHIIPVSQGGATSVANLQLLCQPCNGAKGKKI
jgi:hypothetical protein